MLKIEYVNIDTIKPYKNNAKKHPKEQIEQIKKSIEQFGMDDPIGIWKDEIVEGHGRLIACKELGYTEVPIIRLDHLTDEERKAYTLAHNKLTMNSDFDLEALDKELEDLDIDLSKYGFEEIEDVFDTDFTLESGEKKSLVNMVFSLTQEQADYVENIIKEMQRTKEYKEFDYIENKNSNGNSLFLICKQWEKQKK